MNQETHETRAVRDRYISTYLQQTEGDRPYIRSLEDGLRTDVRQQMNDTLAEGDDKESIETLLQEVHQAEYQSSLGVPYYRALAKLIKNYPQPYPIPALNLEEFAKNGYKAAMLRTGETGTNHVSEHVSEVLCLATAACEYYTIRLWHSKHESRDASGWIDWDHRAIDRKTLKETGVEVRDGQRTEYSQPGPLQNISEHLLYDQRSLYVTKDREGKVIDLVSQLKTQLNESHKTHPLEITAKDAQAFIHYARAREELAKAFYEKSQPGRILAEKVGGYIQGEVICKYLAANLPLDASAKAAFRDELHTLEARLKSVTGLGNETLRKDDVLNKINNALNTLNTSPSN